MSAAVLVPIKDFRQAKQRLSPVLSPPERVELARRMATLVLTAAAPFDLFVACDDDNVAAFAEAAGAIVVWCPGLGLNGALDEAYAEIGQHFTRLLIAHSDLPMATTFKTIIDLPDVAIVADRHGRGTNVIALPTRSRFRFRFGAGSFNAHRHEAVSHDMAVHSVNDPLLAWDVDTPLDLVHPDLQEFLSWLPTNPANHLGPTTKPSPHSTSTHRQ